MYSGELQGTFFVVFTGPTTTGYKIIKSQNLLFLGRVLLKMVGGGVDDRFWRSSGGVGVCYPNWTSSNKWGGEWSKFWERNKKVIPKSSCKILQLILLLVQIYAQGGIFGSLSIITGRTFSETSSIIDFWQSCKYALGPIGFLSDF